MKKFIYLLLIPFLLISCNKDTKNRENEPLHEYDVTLKVSNFDITYGDMKLKGPGNKNRDTVEYNRLSCYAFDSEENLINSIISDRSSDSTFGTLKIKLPQGQYKVVVVAMDIEDNYLHGNVFSDFHISESRIYDAFSSVFNLNVSGETVLSDIELKRIIGQLEIFTEDFPPEEVGSIKLEITGKPAKYFFKDDLSIPSEYTLKINRTSVYDTFHTTNLEFFETAFLKTDEPLTLTFTVKDKNQALLFIKVIEDVHIFKNKRTVVKGNLFSSLHGDPESTMEVIVNDRWEEDIIVEF